MRDEATHGVSRCASGQCGSFIEGQWIATGYALAMTGVMIVLDDDKGGSARRSLRQARGDKQTFNITPAEETFEIFALLISSTGSSYVEVSRSRIFQDNAGPRRVSSLIFVENPIH